eukprot:scaffold644_cov168-Ochromonas_danica.AAC.53
MPSNLLHLKGIKRVNKRSSKQRKSNFCKSVIGRSHWVTCMVLAARAAGLDTPSSPFLDLTVLSQSSIYANFSPPLTDGGSAIYQYKVEWDPDPGVQEVQEVTTSVYLGPNEIQSITTSATSIPEIQTITVNTNKIREVQKITVSQATGGFFFLELDTSSLGGSLQYSGYIEPNYPADASSGNTYGHDVASIISAMNNVKNHGNVSVSKVTIDSQSYAYLVTFPESMGNVPQMSVYTAQLTPAGQASAVVTTVTEGNVIGGTFRLSFDGASTSSLSSQASASDVGTALEALSTVGEVIVARSTINNQLGYSWMVTFISPQNSGNVPPLIPDYSGLTVSNPSADVNITVVSVDGNQLGGSFSVGFTRSTLSAVSGLIPFDASAAVFKQALENMPLSIIPKGSISVSRTGPDEQLGYTWTVTFLDDFNRTFYGDQNLFTANTTLLTGDGSAVTVTEISKGTFQEVQELSIVSSSSINNSLAMVLTFEGETTIPIVVRPSNNSCESKIVEIQKISTTTIDTTTSGGDDDVSMYLQFRVAYGDEVSGWINANPEGRSSCVSSASDLQSALEDMSFFHTVSVSYVSTQSQGCDWTITFVSSIGDIDQLTVQARNTMTASIGGSGSSSKASDDTVTIQTLVNGQKDAIKAALELLPNIGTVTVTPLSSVQGINGNCQWKITFDSNAGDLPSLQVSLLPSIYSSSGSLPGVSTSLNGVTASVSTIQPGTSTTIGGNFALSFRGERTYYLPYDATAREVEKALESLSTIGSVNVLRSVADENNGFTWVITFETELGDLDLLGFDKDDMTGTWVNGMVAKQRAGVSPPFNSLSYESNLPLGSAVVTDLWDLSVTITDLDEGIPYYVRVAAINAVGQGTWAFSAVPYAIPQSQRPGPPTQALLDAVDGKSLQVIFQPPEQDGGQDVTFYKIEYANEVFAPEVQEIFVQANVTREIQVVQSGTSHAIPEVQLLYISTTYSGSPALEVQKVVCDAIGGSFRLSFQGYTTSSIDYDANAGVIAAALENLAIINQLG